MPVLARRVLRGATLALAGAAILLAVGGGTASAHANYVRSNPAADARLARAPAEVRVVFSEPVDPRGSAIAVFDASGKRVDRNDPAASGEPNGLRVSLGPLGEGGYLVAWTALSSVDGHETKGTFAFAVGDAPLPALPDVPNAAPAPSLLELAGRALSFGGVALALGLALFATFVREAASDGERRREGRAFVAAGALLVLGTALLGLDQGARLPPRLGLLLASRALCGLAIAGAQTAGPRAARLSGATRRLVTYAAGLGAALTLTFVSHAAATGSPKELALDFVHIVAVSAWLGGIAGLATVALPSLPARDDTEARVLGATVRRFSLLAAAAVTTIVATGALASLDRLVLVEDLWETPYGIALTAKIALLALTLALAALNLLVWGPRLRRGVGSARRLLVRGVLGESALMAAILVAAGILTAYPPPATASAGYHETRHVEGLRLELLVPVTTPGRNRYVLRAHEGLSPVVKAEKVALIFTMVEHDMGKTELVAVERAPGEYVAEGSPTAMFGTWLVESIVRRTGREDVRTVFTVPIAAPEGGAGASARAIPAGPYTAIVFTDPALPAAAAPLTIDLILVDAKGDPVPGKTPTLTFEGPAPAGALVAREAGPGRYVFQVAALEAGTWQAKVALDAEVSLTYGFEVSR